MSQNNYRTYSVFWNKEKFQRDNCLDQKWIHYYKISDSVRMASPKFAMFNVTLLALLLSAQSTRIDQKKNMSPTAGSGKYFCCRPRNY